MSARIAKLSLIGKALSSLPVLGQGQRAFIARAQRQRIRWADARRLPFADGTVAVVYSSHMVEHLTRNEAADFFHEAFRVLKRGAWIRIAVPDLREIARGYIEGNLDANHFVEATLLASERPRGIIQRLTLAVTGPRHHLWMYDASSLRQVLAEHGFVNGVEVAAGRTHIPDPGALDLTEREQESIYVEAQKA